jgi:hypothetical protein
MPGHVFGPVQRPAKFETAHFADPHRCLVRKKDGHVMDHPKNLMEILVHAQFSNIELAMSRLNSFRRRYKKYLLKTSEERVLLFLKLVEKYLQKPDVVFETAYKTRF